MGYFSRFSPVRAYQDLRFFLASRQPYEFWFLVAALAITGFLIWAFAKDSEAERVYRPNIIYVQQWPATRTDAEIKAQQAIDEAAKQKRLAAEKAAADRRRAGFKRLDAEMDRLGL